MSKNQPTIRDVAKLAQVSHQTVSRVINHSLGVNPETQAKVEAAIAELGYRPNAIARSMARGRTHMLACLAPNLTDYTFASLIEGAESEARQYGYFLLTASAPDEAAFGALVEQLVSDRRTDGLMVINPYADGRHTRLPQNFPTVFVGARPRAEAADSVALDDEGAAKAATGYLLNLGHRQIAMISGPLSEDCSQDRKAGYGASLSTLGLAEDATLMYEGDWSATSGYRAVGHWLQRAIPFTAIFAQNDRMAVGALRALHEAGKRVPGDVSVIGFDDIPLISYFEPPITTMRQDMAQIGREAARLLIHAIERPQVSRQHLRLPAELIVRQSTRQL